MRTYNNNYKPRRQWKERPKEGGLEVIVRDNNLEKALRIFKRKVQKSGLLKEIKMRSFYEKPAEKNQRKKKEAVKRWRKLQKKFQDRW